MAVLPFIAPSSDIHLSYSLHPVALGRKIGNFITDIIVAIFNQDLPFPVCAERNHSERNVIFCSIKEISLAI
jgi:hypothetical protein